MTCKRKFFAYSLCATLGVLSASEGANATCGTNLAGTWYLFALEAKSPSIQVTGQSVVTHVNPTSSTVIYPFKSASAFHNGTAHAIKCKVTVKSTGAFTAPCTSFGVVSHDGGNVNVSGNITVSACNLSGTINIPGDTPVTIQGGYVNGNNAAGIGTQGADSVLYFTLIKQ